MKGKLILSRVNNYYQAWLHRPNKSGRFLGIVERVSPDLWRATFDDNMGKQRVAHRRTMRDCRAYIATFYGV